jgi:proline iminopeptidase
MPHKLARGMAIASVAALTACGPIAASASTAMPRATDEIRISAMPATIAPPAQMPSPGSAPIKGLQAVNGTSLYYEIIGTGAPLFVLHGGPGGSHSYFLPYLEALSDDHRLFFYDQRGTGLSDGHLDLAAISIDQFVEDLEALRAAFGLEKIALMGHSWGAIVALAYALKYQAHLDHLVLVDPTPVSSTFGVEFSQTLQQRVQRLSADAQHELTTTCTRSSAELSPAAIDACNQLDARLRFYDPAKAATVDWAVEENTLNNSTTVRALITASFNRMRDDLDARLPSVRVPTLIVHGDFDPIPLGSSEYLHQHIPDSQIVLISQSGHFPFIEQPGQFAAALRSFLGK